MKPAKIFGWTVSLAIIVMLTVVPYVYYRQNWAHSKRLRVVTEGKMYRSGCLTAEGFRDAVQRYGIRTIINLRDEAPNPPLHENWFNHHITTEEDLCKQLGVKFVFIELDVLSRDKLAKERPKSIQKYLKVMDDPASYPVLLHCQAGLHRTGVFSAIYRMEYEGWSTEQAMHELREHGFGVYRATAADDYIEQYVLTYHPRERHAKGHSAPLPEGVIGAAAIQQAVQEKTVMELVDGNAHAVHVPVGANKTMLRGLEFDLAKAIGQEMDGVAYRRLDSPVGADSELLFTIVKWKNGTNGEATMSVEVRWRDLRPGRVGKSLLKSGSDSADRKGNTPQPNSVTIDVSAQYSPEEANLPGQGRAIVSLAARQIIVLMCPPPEDDIRFPPRVQRSSSSTLPIEAVNGEDEKNNAIVKTLERVQHIINVECRTLIREGKYREAEDKYQMALELDPDCAAAIFGIDLCKKAPAREKLKRARQELMKGNALEARRLAQEAFEVRLGLQKAASELIREIDALSPDDDGEYKDLLIEVKETHTGTLKFGAGINCAAGIDLPERKLVPVECRDNRIASKMPPMSDEEKEQRDFWGGFEAYKRSFRVQDPDAWMLYYKTLGYPIMSMSIYGGSERIKFASFIYPMMQWVVPNGSDLMLSGPPPGPGPYGSWQPYGPAREINQSQKPTVVEIVPNLLPGSGRGLGSTGGMGMGMGGSSSASR